jgi:hypothetical protein
MNQCVRYKRWIEAINNFEKSDYKDWFKFAMLWFSFNGYYSERYSHIGGEKNQIIEFAKDNEDLYVFLLADKQVDFKNVLEEFIETKYPQKRECVKDMRPNRNKFVEFGSGHNSCEDFFKVLYQIRCNFFHGDKSSDSDQDRKLIQWAFEYFMVFWDRFLDEELKK